MRIYTAPEKLKISELEDAVSVFLSGGITGCRNWQEDVITALGSFPNTALYNLDSLVVFNPRREEFVDDDVNKIGGTFLRRSNGNMFVSNYVISFQCFSQHRKACSQ